MNVSQEQAMLPATATKEWKGLTMDELKMRRAKSLVMREVNRAGLMHKYSSTRDNVSQNGVRALLFSGNTVAGLKKADYLLLGAKAIGLLLKLYSRRKK